jgi:flagellin
MRATQIGQIAAGTSSAEVTTTALGGTGTIVVGSNAATTIGASTQGTAAGQSVGSAYSKAAAINAAGVPGLSTTATNNVEFAVANVTSAGGAGTYSLTINGRDVYSAAVVSTTITTQQVADAINTQTANTGVTASLSGAVLRLSAADGRDINIGQTVGGDTAGGVSDGTGGATTVNGVVYRDGTVGTAANATAYSTNAAAVNGGTITLTASDNIVVTADGANLGFAAAGFTLTRDTTTISSSNVLTVAAANSAIQRMDSALTSVSSLRSTFGAIQNRFESTISNLTAVSENLSAARSRIKDADFAQETANLTRAQILQQAGTAMLAQANSLPQGVLALLK